MALQTIPEPAPEIRHVREDRTIAYQHRPHQLSSNVCERYSYIALLTDEGVMIDGYGPRTDGRGNCAHPTWAYPHEANYLISRDDNGDVQFDVWMDKPDLFGEYMATFIGTRVDGRLLWRRVEYTDLGSPRYLRAGLLEPIRFAGVEHKRRRVRWNGSGEIRLTAEVSISRSGRLTFRDPETGLAQWLHEGHALLPEYQVVVSHSEGYRQVDIYWYDDPTAHETYLIARHKCYRVVYPCRSGARSWVPQQVRRILRFDVQPPRYLPVIYFQPRAGQRRAIARGERAQPLLPSRREIYVWSRIAAMEDTRRPAGLCPIEVGGVYFTEKRLTLGQLLIGEPGSGKSILMKLLLRAVHARRDAGYVSMVTNDKGDMRAFLEEELPGVRSVNMNCLEADGHSFRLDTLLRDEPSVDTFCELIVEASKEDPEWGEWGQEMVKIVIMYFIDHADAQLGWDLRDVCLGVRTAAFETIAEQTPEGRHFLKMHGFREGTKQALGVMAHAANALQKLVPAANAMYQHRLAGRQIDLEQFVNGQTEFEIMLLGNTSRAEATLRALNEVIFFFLAQLVSDPSRPEVERLRFGAFIDELLDYKVDLSAFSNKARSKGGTLFGNTQSLSELLEKTKQHHGSSWPLRVPNKVFFKGDVHDAELAARLYGKAYREALTESGAQSHTQGDGTSWGKQGPTHSVNSSMTTNTGFSISQELTDAMGPHAFLDLPSASPKQGVHGYALCDPADGFGYEVHLPFSEWPARPRTSPVENIDPMWLRTVYWDVQDLSRLGLPPEVLHSQRAESKPKTPAHSDGMPLAPIANQEIQQLLKFGGYDQTEFFVPGKK